jgi:hypothetical protein
MKTATRTFGAALGMMLVALAMAGCGDDSKSASSTTTAPSGPRTVNGCLIQAGANCPGANLSGQNLQGVNLAGANLATANLSKSNLSNANLTGANLTDANLMNVTMLNTNLSNANLTRANFTGGNLDNVKLTGATHCGTIRTDGSVDNSSCPQPTPTTTAAGVTTTTKANPAPPACSQATLLKLAQQDDSSVTANGAPVCEGLDAAMMVKSSSGDKVGLYHVGADADSWVMVALVTAGNLPPSISQLCPGLPPKIAGMIGCGSG